jgi:predicted kinase
MDAASRQEKRDSGRKQLILDVPRRTLVVLCGPAGSGKTTFAKALINEYAAEGLRETTNISSDFCRGLICDDENNQQVSAEAFMLFYDILGKRMQQGVFTIADSTALQVRTRSELLAIARLHQYNTCILVFNTSLESCIQRDAERTRSVGEQVVRYHNDLLLQTLLAVPREGWNQFYLVNEDVQGAVLRFV